MHEKLPQVLGFSPFAGINQNIEIDGMEMMVDPPEIPAN
jgi:hypothetical protein